MSRNGCGGSRKRREGKNMQRKIYRVIRQEKGHLEVPNLEKQEVTGDHDIREMEYKGKEEVERRQKEYKRFYRWRGEKST